MKSITIASNKHNLIRKWRTYLSERRINYKKFEIINGTQTKGITFTVSNENAKIIEKALVKMLEQEAIAWYSIDEPKDK